ncbi:centromere protein U isoform X3 [Spea bombifrons]|uniref:centromere protein U isoform X3 n=1 Tax=Spea bombifrons TaxID=233779 RepID=UPI00234B1323|nr:centromere protein U isoform X3 [Spea bombifrons]
MERGGKRRINRQPEGQDNTKTVPPKSPKQKSPYVKKMLIPPEISAILKEPEDLSQDYNEEDYFDPPFHSTAVYAEGEEPLEKEVSKEKSLKQQLLITSWTQQKSKIVATPRSESGKVVRNRTVQDKIIQKTPKATKKAESQVPDAELPHAVESPNSASAEATRPPPISPKENRQGKHTNKSLISRKALSKVKECAPTSGKMPKKAALASRATPKAKTKRRKSIQPQQTSHTPRSPVQEPKPSRVTNSEDDVVEEEMNASCVPPKSSRRRRKSSNLVASKKKQSLAKERLDPHTPGSENSESEDQVPSKEPHRRPSNKDVTSNNAESQGSEDEASLSVSDNSAGLSQTLPNKNKRKPNGHQETPKKGQDKSPERKRKKLNINDLHTTANKAVSKKVWSSTEVPRSSRDMNELDVVLFECEKVYEEYRETVDSNADMKAIDLFFACYKEQLTTSIEDVQKMKNIKKKNAKMQLEIGRKKKRLIEVKGEVIENESKLKQLQKTYKELQEKQSALKKAKEFLSGLGELRKDYLKFREENPEAKETYGMSSLPALLLQSQTIMNAEKHLHDINATLESFIAGEKDVC